MEIFIVIPCLNEERYLAATCASLGFGGGQEPLGRLVLVDNGSDDGTAQVMLAIQQASPPGCVLITRELRRGHVAARRAGMGVVIAVALREKLPAQDVLILQADADTIYLPGYVRAMVDARSDGRVQFIEASSVTARDFNLEFPEFNQLCRQVDNDMESWFAAEEVQVVVDDKVCGFSLVDYCAWGEHQEELDDQGDQVLAETSRLLMRARGRGQVWRSKVESAQALPSRRRLRKHALGYFAGSGYPRRGQWMEAWGTANEAQHFLRAPLEWPTLSRLVRSRQRHQLALFGLLPAICDVEANVPRRLAALAKIIRGSPNVRSPGRLLGLVLELADQEEGILAELLSNG